MPLAFAMPCGFSVVLPLFLYWLSPVVTGRVVSTALTQSIRFCCTWLKLEMPPVPSVISLPMDHMMIAGAL